MKIYEFFNNPKDVLWTQLFQIYTGNIFLFPFAQEFSKELISELETELIKEFGFEFEYADFLYRRKNTFKKFLQFAKNYIILRNRLV